MFSVLLYALTIVFLLSSASLFPHAHMSLSSLHRYSPQRICTYHGIVLIIGSHPRFTARPTTKTTNIQDQYNRSHDKISCDKLEELKEQSDKTFQFSKYNSFLQSTTTFGPFSFTLLHHKNLEARDAMPPPPPPPLNWDLKAITATFCMTWPLRPSLAPDWPITLLAWDNTIGNSAATSKLPLLRSEPTSNWEPCLPPPAPTLFSTYSCSRPR
ncbi:hypothetical protein B0H14DRAFT_389163 [Mycena olivaceomarginata]|nr:hypothetical protein B0H14DRAFT_389163 [Mycena olivaceomarginata]